MRTLLATLFAAGVLAPATGTEAGRAALRQADVEFSKAVAARDDARFLDFLAEDVSFLPDKAPPANGRQAVRDLWARLFDPAGPTLTWTPVSAAVSRSGEMGYTVGTWVSRSTDPQGKPLESHGKYVTIWRKQADGSWKVVLDIGNSSPPPAR